MNITNDKEVMIFKDDNGKYTVGLSRKIEEGKYESGYFPIRFKKGVEFENQTKIKIVNAFLTFYSWEYQEKKGKTYYIMCTDFEITEEHKEEVKETNNNPFDEDPFADFGEAISINDGENNFLD